MATEEILDARANVGWKDGEDGLRRTAIVLDSLTSLDLLDENDNVVVRLNISKWDSGNTINVDVIDVKDQFPGKRVLYFSNYRMNVVPIDSSNLGAVEFRR